MMLDVLGQDGGAMAFGHMEEEQERVKGGK